MYEEVETGQWSLSPTKECWNCMQRMRVARIRREMAADVPLHLAPVIAAYLADNHETTSSSIGTVTEPIHTVQTTTQHQKENHRENSQKPC